MPIEAINIFTILLNQTLSMGYFPNKFKHALIKLIPKPKKPTTNPLNFRPISLLEVPGKIFEKIINIRLRHHLETNNILPDSQHGFRASRSTDTALAITYEKIAQALGEKQLCYVVLRDVAKAFDKVWHNGLKYKLINLKLPPIFTKLLCTFLDQRTASISINNYIGTPFRIRSGVPQGSSLSPTLYSIYTSDIPPPAHDCTNIMYADDITQIITQKSKSRNMMTMKVQREIRKLNNYENKWKIKTNMTKFTIIPLTIRKTTPITIDGNIIPYAKEGTILGMHIKSTGILKHVKHNVNKAQAALTTMRRFNKLPTNIKLHLVKACVTPILTYPPYPLNSLSTYATYSLQKIQNKALRFALNETYPYTRTTKELHITANMKPINIYLYDKGIDTKNKLQHILQDTTYNEISTDINVQEHNWFRKPIKQLIKPPPQPTYTKR